MPNRSQKSSIPLKTRIEFFEEIPPFDQLDDQTRRQLAQQCQVEFLPQGTQFLHRGRTPIKHLRLIFQGKIKLFLKDDSGIITLEDYRDIGDAVGTLGLLRGSHSNLDAVTMEECVFLLIERELFLDLLDNHPPITRYYLNSLTEGYLTKAFSELERTRSRLNTEGSLYLFSAQVGDIVRRRPVTIPAADTVQQAAILMSERRVGALLVTDTSGKITGIITDRDLRSKVVARGRNATLPVREIMTTPVATIPTHTVCFDALLAMMKHRVHHLALEKNGDIVGVLSGHDLMVLQGSSPLYLVREIVAQDNIEALYDLSLQSPLVVSSLIKEGAKAGNITRMITLMNDYIVDRVLSLLQEEMGPPPAYFCWLLMGSEGRREQTFRTDQDNGLLYADPTDEAHAKVCREYFSQLGAKAIEHLVACGFPRCPGNIMASNPQWNQPFSAWAGYFDKWIRTPQPKDVLHATIFFDFRAGYGAKDLGLRLRHHLTKQLVGQELFLRFLAKDCLTTPSALTMFRGFAVERSGEHKNKLDLKHKGLVPFVDFARLMALKHGVFETNTMERLQVLGEAGHISQGLYLDALQGYEFLMQIRLEHQQAQHDEGLIPDNYINPRDLSDLDRHTLKDVFNVINDIKSVIRDSFRLG